MSSASLHPLARQAIVLSSRTDCYGWAFGLTKYLSYRDPSRPTRLIENPEPFKLYVVGPPVPSDDNQIFLTLVYAEIERRWNKTPPFEIVPPDPKEKHGGEEYQARCLEVLRWLHVEGDITRLEVSKES